MRLRFAAVLLGLSQFAFPSLGFADWPGLREAPPGFNNLPFSVPTGEAHWCYDIREEIKPVSREETSFFFEGQKGYLAALKASGRVKMFRIPHTDVAVVARGGCGDICKIDIAIRSSYNLELYKDISLEKGARVEVIPHGDDWDASSGFMITVHGVRRSEIKAGAGARKNGVAEAFVYLSSRSVNRAEAKDSVEYGFKPDEFNDCYDL